MNPLISWKEELIFILDFYTINHQRVIHPIERAGVSLVPLVIAFLTVTDHLLVTSKLAK